MYDEKNKRPQFPHNIILEERSRLSISGVDEVESFDDTAVSLLTSNGALMIRGYGLHVDRLSLDGGELSVEGTIQSLQYEDTAEKSGGLWSKLFR